jgi:hypothetical protein
MAMAIVEATRQITGGVDTHADLHVAAIVDHLGGVIGIETFETTEAGYGRLVGWLRHTAPSCGSGSRAPAPTAPG